MNNKNVYMDYSGGAGLTAGFFIEERMTNNEVKLSVLADIGSSSFIYDMHNIKEVFIFPKIWYRRSLARRLFFGDEPLITTYNSGSTNGDISGNPMNLNDSSISSSTVELNEGKRRK